MAGRRLCISLDPSPLSQDALAWASQHFVRPGDHVHLVTVMQPAIKSELAYGAGHSLVTAQCEADAATLASAQQLLESGRQKLVEQGVPAESITTQPLTACLGNSNDIGRHIVDYTEAEQCDSLVMGSRGLGLRKRAMLGLVGLGSVSEWVVKHAHCNVVVHKAQPPATK